MVDPCDVYDADTAHPPGRHIKATGSRIHRT